MTNYTRKSAFAVVFLLVIAGSGRAQTATTTEEVEFASVLNERIRAASKAEVDAKNDQLQPLIALENQLGEARLTLEREIATLAGRMQALSSAAASCPAMRPTIQPAWREANEDSNKRLALLKKTNEDLDKAHARVLEAEKSAAWQLGNGTQLTTDFDYLYKLWRMDPPQYTWEAMRDHLLAVAHDKKIKSKVTISTGAAAAPIKYQLVSGGVIASATNAVPIQVDPGYYKFWVDKADLADSPTKCVIFREAHSIDLKTNQCH